MFSLAQAKQLELQYCSGEFLRFFFILFFKMLFVLLECFCKINCLEVVGELLSCRLLFVFIFVYLYLHVFTFAFLAV